MAPTWPITSSLRESQWFIDDLVEAFGLAHQKMDSVSGQAFNIGGGAAHTISLLELIELIAELQGTRPLVRFDEWRPADQQYYVSDIQRFAAATGWSPKVNPREGVAHLFRWLRESRRAPLTPVVVPSPALIGAANGNGDEPVPAHVAVNGVAVAGREPRSKRFGIIRTLPSRPLERKIVKFP